MNLLLVRLASPIITQCPYVYIALASINYNERTHHHPTRAVHLQSLFIEAISKIIFLSDFFAGRIDLLHDYSKHAVVITKYENYEIL